MMMIGYLNIFWTQKVKPEREFYFVIFSLKIFTKFLSNKFQPDHSIDMTLVGSSSEQTSADSKR